MLIAQAIAKLVSESHHAADSRHYIFLEDGVYEIDTHSGPSMLTVRVTGRS